ncbi:stemmadenine O-acetyltransferase-like [Corylus avellana]|uniref:stemmadenine O-acetyltransferase-like n=1 Tax=Corylus avellana TaxID=13451 RepID=UPI001E1F2122|nr:stemmadenine O-acetyltransferase-like [Corylus avellana]
MAMMNVEIISKEIIKPSSPTPHHLRTHKLSFLDQFPPTTYIPIILFYHANNAHDDVDHHVQKSNRLKKSLIQTLNRFYPLSGTVKEDHSIDCNDEGVEFYEAKVACKLSRVLQHFNMEILNQFLPFQPYGSHEVLLAVKYNIFECGGVAVGVCVSHRIADGASATTFLGAWSATSRGDEDHVCPKFDAATYFPPKDISWGKGDIGVTKEKIATRRLVFDKSSIAALKEKASSTRVLAVTAFIWKRLMAISKSKPAPARVHVAIHAVNLRPRMVPPMPTHSFGNLWYFAAAVLSPHDQLYGGDDHDSNRALAMKLSKAIKGINGDYVKKLQSDAIPNSLTKAVEMSSKGDVESYRFTSWCRFGLYEADFGWGEPTWVGCPSMPFKNLVVLTSTRDGHGIEAFVNILEEDAVVFDSDEELLPFVSWEIADY